jgi:hypothetical protein
MDTLRTQPAVAGATERMKEPLKVLFRPFRPATTGECVGDLLVRGLAVPRQRGAIRPMGAEKYFQIWPSTFVPISRFIFFQFPVKEPRRDASVLTTA